MTRQEVLAALEAIIAEAVFAEDEQPVEAAERVLEYLAESGLLPDLE